MNYIYIENDKINGCGQVPVANESFKSIEVSDEIYKQFQKDTDKFVYKDGTITENQDYEKIKKEIAVKNEINEINEKLSILDLKRIRAVCEDEIRNEKTGETWLDFYNSQIYDLRTKLKSLESQI